MYDSASNTWTGIPSMVAPRGQASAVSFRGKISILGRFRNEERVEERKQCLKAYDPNVDNWDNCKDIRIDEDYSRHTISCITILKNVFYNYPKKVYF